MHSTFDCVPTSRFGIERIGERSELHLDSITFADGEVIGPDRYGVVNRSLVRVQAMKQLINEIEASNGNFFRLRTEFASLDGIALLGCISPIPAHFARDRRAELSV